MCVSRYCRAGLSLTFPLWGKSPEPLHLFSPPLGRGKVPLSDVSLGFLGPQFMASPGQGSIFPLSNFHLDLSQKFLKRMSSLSAVDVEVGFVRRTSRKLDIGWLSSKKHITTPLSICQCLKQMLRSICTWMEGLSNLMMAPASLLLVKLLGEAERWIGLRRYKLKSTSEKNGLILDSHSLHLRNSKTRWTVSATAWVFRQLISHTVRTTSSLARGRNCLAIVWSLCHKTLQARNTSAVIVPSGVELQRSRGQCFRFFLMP